MQRSGRPDSVADRQSCAIPPGIDRLDIVVVGHRDEGGEILIRELQRTRSRVRHVWPMPDRLPEDAEVIFVDFVPGIAHRIPWNPGEPKAALVLTIPTEPAPDLEQLRHCAPDAVLHRPFTPRGVLISLVMARSHFTYEQRLRGRIEKLDESLRSIRSVERAKAILMAQQSMSEDEAYHFMRRQAMSRRVSLIAVASAIIDTHETLG